MKRTISQVLEGWRRLETRKPLLLQGARQVGKTYILESFGGGFDDFLLLDFVERPELCRLFAQNLEPKRILQDIGVYLNRSFDIERTLIVFDEVQQCPAALTSLKYFARRYPRGFICATGSLLGTGLGLGDFPVGKVQREYMYPMSFFEFIDALGEHALLEQLQGVAASRAIGPLVHEKALAFFREYLITGGLPEVVATYIAHRDDLNLAYQQVRKLQRELLNSYLDDIAKHAGNLKAVRIASVWRTIPEQLARQDKNQKKFVFKGILDSNSNYANLEGPIEWLCKAGLTHRVPVCHAARSPLAAFAKENTFILYLFDVGMLGAMLNLAPAQLHGFDFGQIKGFLAENFVLNELIVAGATGIYSWHENTAEIEFLLDTAHEIVPVEVKSGSNTKAKSLKVFKEKYSPACSFLLSVLPFNYQKHGHSHVPVYLAAELSRLLDISY